VSAVRRRWWQATAVALAGASTVALTQSATGAVFTAQTGDAGNRVSAAATFCLSPGTSTRVVVNDTFVDQSNPGQANGGAVGLTVRSQNGANAQALLRFTLPTVPSDCQVTGATLRLHASSSQGPGTIDVALASTTWTSAAATWSMPARPTSVGTPVGAAAGTPGWHVWTVTDLVVQLYSRPTNEGFLVVDHVPDAATARATVYDSLDNTTAPNPPELVITWG
jgi:hypothetical protein